MRSPASRLLRTALIVLSMGVFGLLLGTQLKDFESEAADLSYNSISTWNGKNIYLSPATHSDGNTSGTPSNPGGRGVCAWSENNNGYLAAWHATNGDAYEDVDGAGGVNSSLRQRGYAVRIGRDSNAIKIANSNSWGATLHIPLHSNAGSFGCANSGDTGTHVLWWSNAGKALAAILRQRIGESTGWYGPLQSPGTNDLSDVCDNKIPKCTTIRGLGELTETNAIAAYVELEFHDTVQGSNWLMLSSSWAWRIGIAVDQYLGYP